MKEPFRRDQADTTQTVQQLTAQAAEMRAELQRLQQALASVNRSLDSSRAQDLLQANEQLVLASLHANTIADTAVSKLDELARSSQRDPLTGTPTRALMLDRINGAISLAIRHQARCAVAFVDIDNFKHINDSLGHDAGDAVLKLVADRLQHLVRRSDSVSRHGGDEFLVLLAELQQDTDLAPIATKILAGVAAPAMIEGKPISIAASMGISVCPDDGVDAVALINSADSAMYNSKRRGPGGFEIYSSALARPPHVPHGVTRALVHATAQPDGEPRLRDLRDANEQLVLGVLQAQELQLQMSEEHRKQVKFLAMVAHELRSPLAPLDTAAELLKHALSDEPLLGRLQGIIKRQVAHMARLVEDLLDGSRASTSTFRLDRRPLEIATVLAHSVESCRPAMESRAQIFTLQLPARAVQVKADSVRLTQVFSNLLDNASKYTPASGRIALRAEVIEQQVVVTISDEGIGISAAALPRIFEMFMQEERAIVANRRGLGIGLAVVRDLVEAHGGTVICRSEGRDRGTEFIVTLPVSEG